MEAREYASFLENCNRMAGYNGSRFSIEYGCPVSEAQEEYDIWKSTISKEFRTYRNSAQLKGERHEYYRVARENFEEAGLPLKNTIELTTKNEYTIPDIWGLKVGRKFLDTGEIESHFEEQQFFEIRKRATLLEYPHTVILMEQDFAERKVIDYYVIYDIKESSKYKPTIVNEYVDNIILGTGEYKCEYEILLSCSDATRRVVIPVRTINVPMYDFITRIEDEIEDVMDRSSEENIFSNIIIDTGDYFLLDMFDE